MRFAPTAAELFEAETQTYAAIDGPNPDICRRPS